MNAAQLVLDIDSTEAVSCEIRHARDRAFGLICALARFEDALAADTYPLIGRGQKLQAEHRPYFEATIAQWKRDLEECEQRIAELTAA